MRTAGGATGPVGGRRRLAGGPRHGPGSGRRAVLRRAHRHRHAGRAPAPGRRGHPERGGPAGRLTADRPPRTPSDRTPWYGWAIAAPGRDPYGVWTSSGRIDRRETPRRPDPKGRPDKPMVLAPEPKPAPTTSPTPAKRAATSSRTRARVRSGREPDAPTTPPAGPGVDAAEPAIDGPATVGGPATAGSTDSRSDALRRIAAEVSGAEDVGRLFESVIDAAFTLFGVEWAGLWTYENGPKALHLAAQRGLSPEIARGHRRSAAGRLDRRLDGGPRAACHGPLRRPARRRSRPCGRSTNGPGSGPCASCRSSFASTHSACWSSTTGRTTRGRPMRPTWRERSGITSRSPCRTPGWPNRRGPWPTGCGPSPTWPDG